MYKIDNKYQKSKDKKSIVEVRLKNIILKIQNKINHKNYKKYRYEICFKNRFFFFKVIVGYKNEN